MALFLIAFPCVIALLALAIPSARLRPWLVTLGGTGQLVLVAYTLYTTPMEPPTGWLGLDPLARTVLGFTAVLFATCSVYVPGYLAQHRELPNRIFCACLLGFMGTLTLVTEAQHLGLMWVGMEASTLCAAPLIYFNKNPRSLEATWKYLVIGSVGIALALLGLFFLGYSSLYSGEEPSLLLSDLVLNAKTMSRSWLHAAFMVSMVGYGTKMGLAPMHTWKPDAYGEAPGLAGTLLAGGLTSGAFLAILRLYQVCVAAGEAEFARKPMVVIGLFSMLVAGVMMARQKDFKRMLAYSSVEHMGILMVGVGLGGVAVFGALLHLVNNALAKGVLFLSAGNIHRAYGSKSTDRVRGALRRTPYSAALLLAGFFAITGSPPFGLFLSEFSILNGAIMSGRWGVAGTFLILLFIVFMGMGTTIIAVVQGEPMEPVGDTVSIAPRLREHPLTLVPGFCLLGLVLLLGIYLPPPLTELLNAAAASLGAP